MTQTLKPIDETIAATNEDAGFGALECPQGRLPLTAMDVRTTISGLVASTSIKQTFRNSLDEVIEATYIFPLPDRAAVTAFTLRVADRTIEAQLKERAAARADYDKAISQGHRAAIAEEERSGVFTLRVGNLPPHESANVELTLVGPLDVSAGEATFRFPLVVAPRYTPGIPLDGPSVGDGIAPDTDQVPDASRVTPPVLLPGFPNPVRLSLQVAFDAPFTDRNVCATGKATDRNVGATDANWHELLSSSLHAVVAEQGPPWTISIQPSERLDRDFILRFPVAQSSIAAAATASTATTQRPGVFGLTLIPPQVPTNKLPQRDVVFVLDRSGSMNGWKMVAARRAVGRIIDSLLDHDHFSLLAFDNSIEQPQPGLVAGTNQNRWKAIEWLGKIESRGGTELGKAVMGAAGLLLVENGKRNAEKIIVVVTDGQVSGEDIVIRQLTDLAGGKSIKIMTIGIDRAVNAGFLRRLATSFNGACELVESEERLDAAMQSLHRLIAAPVLTNVSLKTEGIDVISGSLSPRRIPDLFADRPIAIYGQHFADKPNVSLEVTATLPDGRPWQATAVAQPVDHELLSPMWGRMRVRDLEDAYAAGGHGNAKELADQIVKVSLDCHVLSRFTAYVAVDSAEVVNAAGNPHRVTQPVELPSGWTQPRSEGLVLHSLLPGIPGLARRASHTPAIMRSQESLESRMMELSSDTACGFDAPALERKVVGRDMESARLRDESRKSIDSTSDTGVSQGLPMGPSHLVRVVLEEAIRMQADEITIEPVNDHIQIKYLVNGQFVERYSPPLRRLHSIVKRLKLMAGIAAQSAESNLSGVAKILLRRREITFSVEFRNTPTGTAIRIVLQRELADGTRKQPFWA